MIVCLCQSFHFINFNYYATKEYVCLSNGHDCFIVLFKLVLLIYNVALSASSSIPSQLKGTYLEGVQLGTLSRIFVFIVTMRCLAKRSNEQHYTTVFALLHWLIKRPMAIFDHATAQTRPHVLCGFIEIWQRKKSKLLLLKSMHLYMLLWNWNSITFVLIPIDVVYRPAQFNVDLFFVLF